MGEGSRWAGKVNVSAKSVIASKNFTFHKLKLA